MIGYYFEKQSMRQRFIQFTVDRLLFWLDLLALNVGIGQTKKTKFGFRPDQIDQKLLLTRRKARQIFFHTIELGLIGPPVRDPSRPG